MIKKISTKGMTHAEWLEIRRKTIGGSDAGALCGLNPYSSPYSVYANKKMLIPDKPDNEAMRQGRDLEQYVAERFMQETGKKVRRENSIIYNSEYSFAHADVDRLIVGERAGLECKTAATRNDALYSSGSYPDYYYAQCQHYMMITGLDLWYLAVLVFQRGLYIFEIRRNDEEIKTLAEIERDFYDKSIAGNQEPQTDGRQSTTDALNDQFTQSTDDTADLTLFSTEIEQYFALKERRDEIDELMNEKINAVKAFMQDSERGTCGDHHIVWKTQTRRTFDKARFIKEHPEIDLAGYMKESTSRPFKIS